MDEATRQAISKKAYNAIAPMFLVLLDDFTFAEAVQELEVAEENSSDDVPDSPLMSCLPRMKVPHEELWVSLSGMAMQFFWKIRQVMRFPNKFSDLSEQERLGKWHAEGMWLGICSLYSIHIDATDTPQDIYDALLVRAENNLTAWLPNNPRHCRLAYEDAVLTVTLIDRLCSDVTRTLEATYQEAIAATDQA